MSDRRRLVVAGIAAVMLILLPFVGFLSKNYTDPSLIPADYIKFCLVNLCYALAVIVIFGAALFWIVGKRLFSFWPRYLLAASTLFFLIFTYDAFYHGLFGAKGANNFSAALHIALILFLAGFVFKASKHGAVILAALAFAVANIVLALPAITETVAIAQASQSSKIEKISTEEHSNNSRPNVYYVMLDGYPSASSLSMQQVLAFDNSAFLAAMERRGFYHASEAYSSYNQTTLTMTSIMAGDYVITPDKKATLKKAQRYPRLLTGKTFPPTVKAAKEIGYEFFVVGNNWGQCAGPYVTCYDSDGGNSYLSNTFWRGTPAVLLISTKKRTTKESGRPDVDAVGKLLDHLKKFGPPASPTFTFVHHLSPHPPYLFQADCTERASYAVDFGLWSAKAKPLFLDNLKCANAKALELTDEISARDPGAIIVFQGDHGSAFTVEWKKPFEQWLPTAIHERSAILNLIKMPPRCSSWLFPSINNVNTIRSVLACIGGTEPQFLENKSYIATYHKNDPTIREIDPKTNRVIPIE